MGIEPRALHGGQAFHGGPNPWGQLGHVGCSGPPKALLYDETLADMNERQIANLDVEDVAAFNRVFREHRDTLGWFDYELMDAEKRAARGRPGISIRGYSRSRSTRRPGRRSSAAGRLSRPSSAVSVPANELI